jgi:mRNA interferase YafQ
MERKLRFKPRKTFDVDLKHLATIDHQIVDEVRAAIEILLTGRALPAEFGDHQLQRRLAGYHEFQLRDTSKGQQPSERNGVVVIYAIDEDG